MKIGDATLDPSEPVDLLFIIHHDLASASITSTDRAKFQKMIYECLTQFPEGRMLWKEYTKDMGVSD